MGQKQTSRPDKLVHHTEHHDRNQHEDERCDNLGEGVEAGIGGVARALMGTRAPLPGETSRQRRKRERLGKGELVNASGETVGADGAPGGGSEERIFQVESVEEGIASGGGAATVREADTGEGGGGRR